MAIVSTKSNHVKAQELLGNIAYVANTLKIILMNTTFAFDKDTHATLADVTADQIATGNGYTQDNKIITGAAVAEDDGNDRGQCTCDNVTWTASGGSIGPVGAAIIYDDTSVDDTVIGCIDFGADITTADGLSLQIQDIVINNS